MSSATSGERRGERLGGRLWRRSSPYPASPAERRRPRRPALLLAALVLGALLLAAGLAAAVLWAVEGGGHSRARSQRSFADIADRIAGMSAAEVIADLGEPDSRQPLYVDEERWIWWNYTYLAGEDCPPERRGQVVHLEVLFRKPEGESGTRRRYSQWFIAQPFGIRYRTPGSTPSQGSFPGEP